MQLIPTVVDNPTLLLFSDDDSERKEEEVTSKCNDNLVNEEEVTSKFNDHLNFKEDVASVASVSSGEGGDNDDSGDGGSEAEIHDAGAEFMQWRTQLMICMELILFKDYQVPHRGGLHLDHQTIGFINHHMEHLRRMKLTTLKIGIFFPLHRSFLGQRRTKAILLLPVQK